MVSKSVQCSQRSTNLDENHHKGFVCALLCMWGWGEILARMCVDAIGGIQMSVI